MVPRWTRRQAVVAGSAVAAAPLRRAFARPEQDRLRHWGGINHGTGFFPDEPFLSTCIAAGRELGLGAVRTRMNTVGGRHEGAPFTWARRDLAFDRYRDAGFQLHCILSFREFVDRPTPPEWQRNWRAFVRAVMSRYRDHVRVWIIDNEPENRFGDYLPTPEECVAFTRIAWEELHDLGIEDRCRIESPPAEAIDSPFLEALVSAGIADWCHVIGTHAYNDQIEDRRIRRPWQLLAAAGVRDRPVAISEAGSIARWAPSGYRGGAERWRAVQYRYLRLQAKAFGYDYCLAFDLDRWRQRETEWRVASFDDSGAGFTPVPQVWDSVRSTWGEEARFGNGGFEEPEDGLGRWFVLHRVHDAAPSELTQVDFPRDAGLARTGGGCCRMRPAGEALAVRQVADGLQPGRRYRVSAQVWSGSADATLTVRGFERCDGLAERSCSPSERGRWTEVAVDVVPSNPWLVVELRGGAGGTEHRWDDVAVVGSG